MSKTIAPLLSFEASGSISGDVQYARLRGVNYAKRIVVGEDADSAQQALTRGVFSFASDVWKRLPGPIKNQWEFYGRQKKKGGRNLFIGQGVSDLRGDNSLVQWPVMVTTQGGIASRGVNVGVFANSIFFIGDPPALPPGWTAVARHLACILQQDPYSPTDTETFYATGPGLDPGPIIGGLPTGLEFYCWAWWEVDNRDGYRAYTEALTTNRVIP